MGSTKLSENELASRIAHGPGRYELAAKGEVKAFVDQRLKALSTAVEEQIDEEISAERKVRRGEIDIVLEEVNKLHLRIKELELTAWQRFKRWAESFVEDILFAFTADPSEFPMDDRPATILPHGTQAELDASDAVAFAAEREMRAYEPLRRALREMPTECAEDLADNPVVLEAIEHIRAFEGEKFDSARFPFLKPPSIKHELPELQGLPEYTAEEMPSVPEQRRTHDGELTRPAPHRVPPHTPADTETSLEMKPQHDLDEARRLGRLNAGSYLEPGKFRIGERVELTPEEMFPSLGDPEE